MRHGIAVDLKRGKRDRDGAGVRKMSNRPDRWPKWLVSDGVGTVRGIVYGTACRSLANDSGATDGRRLLQAGTWGLSGYDEGSCFVDRC